MTQISTKYRDHLLKMMAVTKGSTEQVTEKTVRQAGNPEILPFIDRIVEDSLLPGSGIVGIGHLEELHAASKNGESCLLLVEHYSNFDLPVLHYLLRKASPAGAQIADSLVAIAGIKLNETNPVVSTFTEAYSRLVIYPSRSIEQFQGEGGGAKEAVAELMRSSVINRAAMKELSEIKKSGNIVLVFPAGTRFRPWEPSTKKGVREIDSYVKGFSKMCLLAINGNILRLNPSGKEMDEDLLCEDRVIYTSSPVLSCEEFRERVKHEHHFKEDKKQAVVDAIMVELDKLHETAEKGRLQS